MPDLQTELQRQVYVTAYQDSTLRNGCGHNAPFGQLLMMLWLVWSGMSTNNFLTYSLEDADAARSCHTLRSPYKRSHRKRFFLSHCGVPPGHWLGPMDETRHHAGMFRYGGKKSAAGSVKKTRLTSIRIPIIEIRLYHEGLIIIMGICVTVKTVFILKQAPELFLSQRCTDVWENWVKLL